mmetsp:Transcript_25192/g.57291  ORF Transcript_25192/g.57291 Transcript_25192/m.57291 type:complete len:484 (+) Transcript_25192:99-1550(+)
MPVQRWPPTDDAQRQFSEFDLNYRRSAQRLVLAKPTFNERLEKAMSDLVYVAVAEPDKKNQRDKAMELSLKWHRDNAVVVLVEHSLLARNEEDLRIEVGIARKMMLELRKDLSKSPFLRMTSVVDSLMSKLGDYAIAADYRVMFTATKEALRRSSIQYRSVGAPGQQAQFTADMEESGPTIAFERTTGGKMDPVYATVFCRDASVMDTQKTVICRDMPGTDKQETVPATLVTAAEEEACATILLSLTNVAPGYGEASDFLLKVLKDVRGGKKARHLIKVVRVMQQREGGSDECNALLLAMCVLLMCVKRRFQSGGGCEANYLDIHHFFSGFPIDSAVTLINQKLAARYFDIATSFRQQWAPNFPAPPTGPADWAGTAGTGAYRGPMMTPGLKGGHPTGVAVPAGWLAPEKGAGKAQLPIPGVQVGAMGGYGEQQSPPAGPALPPSAVAGGAAHPAPVVPPEERVHWVDGVEYVERTVLVRRER